MRPPALRIHADELVIDNFAGGGGASTGLEWAIGRSPDFAINHDPKAVAMHAANHPGTKHFCEDVFDVHPREVVGSRRIGLAWFSPDCTFFSKARGAKPFRDRDGARRRRGLAGVVIRWASLPKPKKPRIILMENVEEFQDWGPLDENGMPDPLRAGLSFRRWLAQLRNCGFEVEYRELVASDYGAPTKRKRLFVIARSDGKPIVWPKPTHGPALQPYRTAAECIDFGLPVHSIFLTREQGRAVGVNRPLADNTMRRIARGVFRYIINNPEPFIVPITHTGDARVHSIAEPLRTITTAKRGEMALVNPFLVRTAHGERDKKGRKRGRGEHSLLDPMPTQPCSNDFALAAPTLIQSGYGEREGQAPRSLDIKAPLGTVVASNKHALVAAFISRYFSGRGAYAAGAQMPLPTITAWDHHALVTSHLMVNNTGHSGGDARAPLPVVTSTQHIAEVRAFLVKYFGTDQDPQMQMPLHTVTTKDRFGLVTVHGEPYAIADLRMRMLAPRELFNAQSFPRSYLIEVPYQGKTLTKGDQVALCGNSVPPVMGQVLAAANLADHPLGEVAA